MITPSFSVSATQPVSPKLLLDWTTGTAQPGVDVVRTGTATFIDSNGVLQDASADTQRIDYSTGTASLLVENSRTNSIRNNTIQGAVAGTPGTVPNNWSIPATGAGLTRQIVGVGVQNGVNYIDLRFSGTTNATSLNAVFFETNAVVAASPGQTWSASSWVALIGGSFQNITSCNLNIRFNSAAGAFLTLQAASLLSSTSAMQRFTNTFTAGNANTQFVAPLIIFGFSSGVAVDVTLRVGLPQLELGDSVTSVIKTTSAAVTRNSDVATMTSTNFSDWFNAAKGTFRIDFTSIASGNRPAFAVDDNTANEGMIVKTQGNVPTFEVIDGGSPQASVVAGTVTANIADFAYVSYDVDFFGIARPTARQVDTSGTVPTVDRMRIGSDQAGNFFNGRIQKIQFWD